MTSPRIRALLPAFMLVACGSPDGMDLTQITDGDGAEVALSWTSD
jgi:hypothetical protein